MNGIIKWRNYFPILMKKMLFYRKNMILGSLLILLLVSGLFGVLVLGSSDDSIPTSTIGVVMDGDDPLTAKIRSLVAGAPEIKDIFDIRFLDEKEGTEQLKQGEIEALFIVPSDFIQSLISGKNSPIVIRYPLERIGLPTLLIRQLTDACGKYILDTEAGIYSVKDWYLGQGHPMPVDKENELNWVYLNTLLNRKDSFRIETISTTDGVSKSQYYFSAMIVLWLLLIGLGCYDMIGRPNHALSDRLALYGLSRLRQSLARMAAFSLLYLIVGIVGLILPAVFAVIYLDASPALFAAIISVTLLAASCVFLIYRFIRRASGAMLCLLLTTLAAGYVSGLFYPLSYLPSVFRTIAEVLPVRQMFRTLITAYQEDGFAGPVTGTVLYALGLFTIALIPDLIRSGRHREAVAA